MIDTILSILTNPEKLLIALPITIISIAIIIIIIPPIKSLIKNRSIKVGVQEKKQTFEKINFREEFNRITTTRDFNQGIKRLCLLANKFLSQLFEMQHAFTYQEIKKEAEVYGFPEVIELCNILSNLNFAKNTYSESDFKNLSNAFTKVLDSYENIILEDWEREKKQGSNTKEQQNNAESIFAQLIDFMSITHSNLKQLERYLITNHPNLFKKEAKDYKEEVANIDGIRAKIRHLIRLGYIEIRKRNTAPINSIYSAIMLLLKELSPKEKGLLSNQVEEFHKSLLCLIGIKAASEVIEDIKVAASSGDYERVRQLFQKLEYIYYNMPKKSSMEIHKRWSSLAKKMAEQKKAY